MKFRKEDTAALERARVLAIKIKHGYHVAVDEFGPSQSNHDGATARRARKATYWERQQFGVYRP